MVKYLFLTKNQQNPAEMHAEVVEKRSFNGFSTPPSVTNNNNIILNPNLLAAPKSGLRRCRSASPAPSRSHYQQQQNGTGVFGNGMIGCAGNQYQLLTLEQQTLIRKSWQKIPKNAFGAAVFEKMIETCPAMGRLFDPPADPSAIARHERYFWELTQCAVDGMGEPEKCLGPWLEMLGRGHAQFRVKRAHWDCLGETLSEAICQSATITGRQRRETVRAWRILLSFLADRLGNMANSSQDGFGRIQLLQLVANGPVAGGEHSPPHQKMSP